MDQILQRYDCCDVDGRYLRTNVVNVFVLVPAAPDFAEVYKFIGSVFDPGVAGHLRNLKDMTAIDRETVSL